MNNLPPSTRPTEASAPVPLFGFSVVLSPSEMATLTQAMEKKVQNARWFASNNLCLSRNKVLADCDRTEKRIAELKAMEPNARCAATAPEAARDLCQGGSPGQLADVACSACPRCGSSDQGHNCTKMAGEKSPNGPLPMVDHSAGWPYTDPNIDCDC